MMRKLDTRKANFIMTEVLGIVLALAVAFFFVAMPADVFGRLVSASGLPAILPAVAPPLGETARMIVGALAGSLAGMAVILFFLLLDGRSKKRPETVHPFFVNNDLAPMEMMPSVKAKPLDIAPEREAPIVAPFEIVSEPSESEPNEAAEGPIFLDFRAIRAAAKPMVDQVPLDLGQWRLAEPDAASEPRSLPITSPDRRTEDESISALMARLEAGLEKRVAHGAAPSKAPEINRSGAGLRSTLDELRKMAVKR